MSDNEEENEDVLRLEQEVESWKAKYKSLELKKRESDLSLNKIKTEINSLRSLDKLWKDACKTIFHNMRDVQQSFNTQIDQVMDGISAISMVGERIRNRILLMKKVQKVIFQLQRKIAQQDETILNLNGKIRNLAAELADKTNKVERLSMGIEEEVERLIKPMREKLADAMTLVMKEKAARAQERRELADLWPKDHIMPTLLMRYRALTDDECERRIKLAKEQDASLALSLEIKANVVESRMWEIKYDDYGRQFFQHMKTGETREEEPEIMSYKPPPGRDELGNVITSEDNDSNNWLIMSDNRGQIYYKHRITGNVSFLPPFAYQKIPAGKPVEQIVAEAATTVLNFIKDKISKHIDIKRKRKIEMENPLTFDEQKKKEKADRNRTAEEIAAAGPELTEEGEPIDLSLYQYDIETVELLASKLVDENGGNKRNDGADPAELRSSQRSFLVENSIRKFDEDLYEGKEMKQMDLSELNIPKLRGIVEELAFAEEKLEKKLVRTRHNLKDFSFLLQEKVVQEEDEKFRVYKEERITQEKEARAQRKLMQIERLKTLKNSKAKGPRKHVQEGSENEKQQQQAGDESPQEDVGLNEDNMPREQVILDALKVDASLSEYDSNLHSASLVEDSQAEGDTKTTRAEGKLGEGESNVNVNVEEDSTLMSIDPNEKDAMAALENDDLQEMVEGDLDEETEEQEDAIARDCLPSDELLRTELYGDPVAKLFGELNIEDIEADFNHAMLTLCKNLSNFAMFCGFNNLQTANYPLEINSSYSFLGDCVQSYKELNSKSDLQYKKEKSDIEVGSTMQEDDEWLSSHFFLGCSKEQLDQHKQVLVRKYESKVGFISVGPLDPETVVYESRQPEEVITRSLDHSYTPITRTAKESSVYEQYMLWKNQQLLADVVRIQLQQSAIWQVHDRRLRSFQLSNSNEKLKSLRLKESVSVADVVFEKFKFNHVTRLTCIQDSAVCLQLTVGSWSLRTSSVAPDPFSLLWLEDKLTSAHLVNTLQTTDMVIELVSTATPGSELKDATLARGSMSFLPMLGPNLGRCMDFNIPMTQGVSSTSTLLGNLQFEARIDVKFENLEVLPDPLEKNRLEFLHITGQVETHPIVTNHNNDDSSAFITGKTFRDGHEEKQFRLLVSDLRGDHSNPANESITIPQMLTGDYALSTLMKATHSTTPKPLKPLPNFSRATLFLEKRLTFSLFQTRTILSKIQERIPVLLDLMKSKNDSVSRQSNEAKSKLKRFTDQAEEAKKEVLRIMRQIVELRKVTPEPKQPELPELPPVPYVPELPATGGLDARGKKKKALPTNDLKQLLEEIENGGHDGKESVPLPENLFPSQSQMLKIGKVIETRNDVLNAKRIQENQMRDKILEHYETEKLRWEATEKRRLYDLEKAKKESRRINLKFDHAVERMQRFEAESKGLEIDLKSFQDVRSLHEKSIESFKIHRIKLQLEKERQEKYINSLRIRLLRAINARRFALDYPSSARDEKQMEEFQRQADEALSYLKMEIFECKNLLVQEGLRLRHQLHEEETVANNELTRINVCIEVVTQRDLVDHIVSKYKVEVQQLQVEMEKHKLLEADKDDVGLETVEDLGERFVETKTWNSPNVLKCQRMIELLMAKVEITEGYNRSTSQSQRMLVDMMYKQFSEQTLTTVKDSWLEVSDYERAQALASDTLTYLRSARNILQDLSKSNYQLPILQYQLAVKLREDQIKSHHVLHEQETKTVRESTQLTLVSARQNLANYRETTEAKLLHLEQSIIDLSKECQKVREELLAQQMVYDDKMKVLWAFIHTLQTALQQLSAKMEIIIEEREKIVITSKLLADNTRHQLRIERKHCANLLFIIHSQRGMIQYLKDVVKKVTLEAKQVEKQQKFEKYQLKKELWENVFTFSRLCTDVDLLFEFFATRIANLAGSRAKLNDALAYHNAALVLSSLCKNPKAIIRRAAARALGNMGWNGFVETRIILWDCMMYWKMVKTKVISREQKEFENTLDKFNETGQYESVINFHSEIEEFVPSGNMSLRSIIKQRRQWALRAARRMEGPNTANQKLLNIRDGVLISLLQLSIEPYPAPESKKDPNNGKSDSKDVKQLGSSFNMDWEISRNAALAISIASYEPSNHHEMVHHPLVLQMIMKMCGVNDAEIQTHAAVTIANLCYKDEEAQEIFGQKSIQEIATNAKEGYRSHSGGIIPKLLEMLTGPVADVLEAATAALANLTCYCDANCQTVFQHDGVRKIMNVITQSYSENLLDLDQNDEVQANAAEILANISRFSTQESIKYFNLSVIDALVIMCASSNKQLRRHVSLVLGNIAQSEKCRDDIGMKGGIEALFLTLEDPDSVIQANALWALSNLMWHPPNQERAGRFMKEIIQHTQSLFEPVMINASILLGNVLYYNTTNRVRFLETEGAFELLISYVRSVYPPDKSKIKCHTSVIEASLRSMLSLSYLDSIAMWLGEEGKCIPVFIFYLQPPCLSKEAMRYSLEIICNLCLHHANRRIIYDEKGIDAIVPLHTDEDSYVRDLSVQVIEHLEDITPPEVLARARNQIGLERMVTLASNADPLVRAVAAEAIGEEIWQNPAKQTRAQEIGAIDSLLGIVNNPNESIQSLLPALWSLRNLLNNHAAAQAQFGYRDGIKVVCNVIRKGLSGAFHEQVDKIFEGCTACLIAAVTKEPRNSRRLVMVGLDAVLEISEESSFLKKVANIPFAHSRHQREVEVLPEIAYVTSAIRNEGIQALVNSLLLLLAPYNYVVCRNCSKKQDLHGTSCYFCGHRLLVDVDVEGNPELAILLGSDGQNQSPTKYIRTSNSANAKNVPWRHAGKAMDTGRAESPPKPAVMQGRSESKNMAEHVIGGAMGSIGAGIISSSNLDNQDVNTNPSKSYFSRSLPVKPTSSPSLFSIEKEGMSNKALRPTSSSKRNKEEKL